MQHHAEVVEPCLHALIGVVLPAVEALRSQTAKDAMSLLLVSDVVDLCCAPCCCAFLLGPQYSMIMH